MNTLKAWVSVSPAHLSVSGSGHHGVVALEATE